MSQPILTNTALTPAEAVKRDQKLRMRRLGMSFGSYLVTFSIVVYCWVQGMISLGVTAGFLVFASLINATFWWLIRTGRNLKLQDPSMTSAQMIVSLLPPIWVMAFLDAGQARAIFLLIAVVPMLFGILALTTRQFIVVGVWFFALYGLLHLGLWAYRPEVLNSELGYSPNSGLCAGDGGDHHYWRFYQWAPWQAPPAQPGTGRSHGADPGAGECRRSDRCIQPSPAIRGDY